MNQNRIKLIALVTSIFFIVLAELNQRHHGNLLVQKKNAFDWTLRNR